MSIQQFRDAVYQTIGKRAAATLDLVDALTVAGHVASPVALSEEVPFQRRFSSVYDVLDYSDLDQATLAAVLYAQQPDGCETVAGYEVYAVDTTPNERPTAETLADRGLLKSQRDAPVRLGQKFSWLVRLVQRQTSWVAPWDVRRVPTTSTDTQTAVAQVQALDRCSDRLKVLVADSLYCNHLFLGVFLLVQTVCALVRLRRNQNLYEAPSAKAAGAKGAPRKHGPVFRLAQPARSADRTETFQLAWQTVRLSAWTGLHLRKLPALVGLALRVEFLKADGTPRYKLPLWLFWTGPTTVALPDLCRMYLWRFAIEHAFRFMKQHLGLNANRSTQPANVEHWMWLCALAYWQLLLLRDVVDTLRPAWYPRPALGPGQPLTPGQVQRQAQCFLLRLGTPAPAPRPAGKGSGRPNGFRPPPRTRYPVVRKGHKRPKTARTRAPAAV